MPDKIDRRVLHIMSSYGGGISTFINNIASEIYKLGIVFDVVTYGECPQSFIDTIQRTGGDVYQLKNPKKEGWKQFSQSLSRVLELYDYNTVHCHISGYRSIAYKLLVDRYTNADFIIHAHYYVEEDKLSIPQRLLHYINQQINQNLSEVFVGSSRQAVQSLFGYNIDKEAIVIIPNSINPKDFMYDELSWSHHRNKYRRNFGIDKDTILVGQIGRLDPVKNHQWTLKIASLARDRKLNMAFVFAGAGELQADLKQSIAKADLEAYVQLIGRISPINELYPALDVVIFPSFTEGLGTTAIESQAAGVPVVLSNTIPSEVELHLNLTHRLSLEESTEIWLEKLISSAAIRDVPRGQRLRALERYNYTNMQAAKLYATFIAGKTNY